MKNLLRQVGVYVFVGLLIPDVVLLTLIDLGWLMDNLIVGNSVSMSPELKQDQVRFAAKAAAYGVVVLLLRSLADAPATATTKESAPKN